MTLLSAITDLNDSSGAFGLDPPTLKLDHCDLLLDALDAQLGQLQVCLCHFLLLPHILEKLLCRFRFSLQNGNKLINDDISLTVELCCGMKSFKDKPLLEAATLK